MKYEKLTANIILNLFNIPKDSIFFAEYNNFEINEMNQLDFLLSKISELNNLSYSNTEELYLLKTEVISTTFIYKKINQDFKKAKTKIDINNKKTIDKKQESNNESSSTIFKDNVPRRLIRKI
jgi:uncharacterized protein YgiM (DUF1202 family)